MIAFYVTLVLIILLLLSIFLRVNLWKILEPILLVCHLIYFYFMLIPPIALKAKEKCYGYYYCRRFFYKTFWGYTIDFADSQWRQFRQNLYIFWILLVFIFLMKYVLQLNMIYRAFKQHKQKNKNKNDNIVSSTKVTISTINIEPDVNQCRQLVVNKKTTQGLSGMTFTKQIDTTANKSTVATSMTRTTTFTHSMKALGSYVYSNFSSSVKRLRNTKSYSRRMNNKMLVNMFVTGVVSVFAVFIQHNLQAIIIYIIACLGYLISTCTYKYTSFQTKTKTISFSVVCPWVFGICTLLFKEFYQIQNLIQSISSFFYTNMHVLRDLYIFIVQYSLNIYSNLCPFIIIFNSYWKPYTDYFVSISINWTENLNFTMYFEQLLTGHPLLNHAVIAVNFTQNVISKYIYSINFYNFFESINYLHIFFQPMSTYTFPSVSHFISVVVNFILEFCFSSRFHRYSGMYSWRFPTNFLVLRIISFSIDRSRNYYNLKINTNNIAFIDGSIDKIKNCIGDDDDEDDDDKYNFLNYITYIFYLPLYIAGPIITFKNFIKNQYDKVQTINNNDDDNNQKDNSNSIYDNPSYSYIKSTSFFGVSMYMIRWLFCLGLMEFMTHYVPVFAIISSGLFVHLSVQGYLTLKIMWLKFLIIWRFFRLWALTDGVEPPENMTKCMSNNYSLESFWKGWHCSFHEWIISYMYIPLGGRYMRLYSVWIIFLFVALWHDAEWKLLIWGLLNAVFYATEVLGKKIMTSKRMSYFMSNNAFRQIVGILAGASYIFVLVFINLIGYAIGTNNWDFVLQKLFSKDGIHLLLVTFYFLCWGVRLMFIIEEIRKSFNSLNTSINITWNKLISRFKPKSD